MKKLEHSDIRELCKSAIQQIVDEKRRETFGVSDVIEKVLAAYPELDRVRVEDAAKTCLRGDLSLPWPGYNGGQLFVCACGLHFDTSAGYARHKVYECKAQSEPHSELRVPKE
jgi:hypothetical protein